MEDKNLNLKKIIKSLSDKNVRDYLYISVFFILFSIFIFFAIKDDLVHAGADFVDEEVVVDGNLVTSRRPDDLPAFMREILKKLAG